MKKLFWIVALGAMTERHLFGQGTLLWNESSQGELGKGPGLATPLGSLNLGTNSVVGQSEFVRIGGGGAIYGDYFTFTVLPGYHIQSVQLTVDRQIAAWIGNPSYSSEFGYVITSLNGELLSQFNFTSVTPGNYGMYMSNYDLQSDSTIASYRLDFVVSAVPEPSTWALLGLGSALFWCAARRRRK
jgi:hypothetical protein